ncbi:MAG: hypothetical protein INQ03_11520 [Candidatus Heimdallarchaeota archaeon]|nr:hypothetical protein [Candidatus Heimdallarchaeota archaeon]
MKIRLVVPILITILISTSAQISQDAVIAAYTSNLLGEADTNQFRYYINNYNANFSFMEGGFVYNNTKLEFSFSSTDSIDLLNQEIFKFMDLIYEGVVLQHHSTSRIWDYAKLFILPVSFELSNSEILYNYTLLQSHIEHTMMEQFQFFPELFQINVEDDQANDFFMYEQFNDTHYMFLTADTKYGLITQFFQRTHQNVIYFRLEEAGLIEFENQMSRKPNPDHFGEIIYETTIETTETNYSTSEYIVETPTRQTEEAFLPLNTHIFTVCLLCLVIKRKITHSDF